MYVGHFGFADLLVSAFPNVPPLVAYSGVSFPDLLWGALVIVGVEKVKMDQESALQTRTQFVQYPYSHSLVLTNFLAIIPAGILSLLLGNPLAGVVFILGSISHWILDVVVRKDVPIVGFGPDLRIGLGLWDHSGWAFAVDYLLFAIPTLAVFPWAIAWKLLAVAAAFRVLNANAFFGWTRRNPWPSSRIFAGVVLLGL